MLQEEFGQQLCQKYIQEKTNQHLTNHQELLQKQYVEFQVKKQQANVQIHIKKYL